MTERRLPGAFNTADENDLIQKGPGGIWVTRSVAEVIGTSSDVAMEQMMLANWSDGPAVGGSSVGIHWIEARQLFYLCGNSGNVDSSPDGVVWTNVAGSRPEYARRLAMNPGGLGVTAGNSVNSTANGGVTWTFRLGPEGWDDVEWVDAQSQFILVGPSSIRTSPTGVTWTNRSVPGVAEGGIALATNGTLAVGIHVGGDKFIRTSNGIAWTDASTGVGDDLHDLAWTGSLFVAVGAAGRIMTSPDGTTWTTRASGTTAALRAVIPTANCVIAVGDNGALVGSISGLTWQSINHPSGAGSFDGIGLAWNGSVCLATNATGDISRSLARLR